MSGSRASGKVTVGCKLPNGYVINFEKFDPETKTYNKIGEVTLAGANASSIIGGYGLTEGVDADLFAEWLKLHKDDPAVKLNLIFAQPTQDRAAAEANEKAAVKSGFEPIDPDKPARGIERADPPTKR